MVLTYISKNTYWLIPCFCSVVFSLINIILVFVQRRLHKEESKRSNELLIAQISTMQTQKRVLMFDSRLRMYNAILRAFQIAFGENRVDDDLVREYLSDTMNAEFLFDKNIAAYCHNISDTFRKIIRVRKQLESSQAETDREFKIKKINEDYNLVSELMDLLDGASSLFSPYFSLHDIEANVELLKTQKANKDGKN